MHGPRRESDRDDQCVPGKTTTSDPIHEEAERLAEFAVEHLDIPGAERDPKAVWWRAIVNEIEAALRRQYERGEKAGYHRATAEAEIMAKIKKNRWSGGDASHQGVLQRCRVIALTRSPASS